MKVVLSTQQQNESTCLSHVVFPWKQLGFKMVPFSKFQMFVSIRRGVKAQTKQIKQIKKVPKWAHLPHNNIIFFTKENIFATTVNFLPEVECSRKTIEFHCM